MAEWHYLAKLAYLAMLFIPQSSDVVLDCWGYTGCDEIRKTNLPWGQVDLKIHLPSSESTCSLTEVHLPSILAICAID